MERNVMGELNMYRGAGAKPNFSDIARRRGMDRHTVARCWSEGPDARDRRSERESAFERVWDVAAEKAALPGMTKRAVYEFLLHMHNDPPLPGTAPSPRGAGGRGWRSGPPSPRRTPGSRPRRAASCGSTGRRTSVIWLMWLMWLMWLYLFGQPDETLRALRGREAPCGIRSTPGSSPRSSGGR